MITRTWRGWTSGGDADAYERFLIDELFPSMRRIEGFLGAEVLRRADGDEEAFVTLTRFASLDAIRAFAGDDYERPVLEPRARELLAHHDDRAEHYETAPARQRPQRPVTRSRLAADMRRLGVQTGAVLMVHTRMSALGWVVGGSEAVVRALLDVVGPEGTLMAYASWEEHVYHEAEWPAAYRDAYLSEPPAFDVATAEAARDHGRIPERLRTWPGAHRSGHPEAGVVAVGARAGWLTDPHPDDDAYGPHSPFARLVKAGGHVLLLGAPLETTTLLHHAEAIARAPDKRRVTFRLPVAGPDGVAARTYTDIDTSAGAFSYEDLGLEDDEFAVIAGAALAARIGVRGQVGESESHLFGAHDVTDFAVSWLEERFGQPQ
jgi:aminoglycoside 3-N-acetyltransferase